MGAPSILEQYLVEFLESRIREAADDLARADTDNIERRMFLAGRRNAFDEVLAWVQEDDAP